MPTYEYECPNCGVFEQFHSINTCLTHCPTCSSEVKRLISKNSNIIFKGSGFYVTDNRSKDYPKKSASAKSGSGASSSTSAGSKIETKAS